MTAGEPGRPLADVLMEGRQLSAALSERGIRARLLGGVGVRLHAHGEPPTALRRTYGDLDFVVRRADAQLYRRAVEDFGYQPNTRFNALRGGERLLHFDPGNGRQLDTFVGVFHMCHSLDLDGRLPAAGASLAPADLLLTKLQIFEVNEKDLQDVVLLLRDHPLGEDDNEAVNLSYLASVCGRDWGWHTTVSDNLAKLQGWVATRAELEESIRSLVGQRVEELQTHLARASTTFGWKARSRIGRRIPWYELPEEVGRS